MSKQVLPFITATGLWQCALTCSRSWECGSPLPLRQPQHAGVARVSELSANMLIVLHAGNPNMLLAYLMAAGNPAMDPGLMHALLFQSAAAQAAQQVQAQTSGAQGQAPDQGLLQLQQLGMLGAGMGGAMGGGFTGLHHLAVSFQPSLAWVNMCFTGGQGRSMQSSSINASAQSIVIFGCCEREVKLQHAGQCHGRRLQLLELHGQRYPNSPLQALNSWHQPWACCLAPLDWAILHSLLSSLYSLPLPPYCICLLGEGTHLDCAAAHYRLSLGWASPPTLLPQLRPPLPCWPSSSSSGRQQQQQP